MQDSHPPIHPLTACNLYIIEAVNDTPIDETRKDEDDPGQFSGIGSDEARALPNEEKCKVELWIDMKRITDRLSITQIKELIVEQLVLNTELQ